MPPETAKAGTTRGVAVAIVVAACFAVLLVVAERVQAGGSNEGVGGVFRFRDHGPGVTAWGWPLLLGLLASASMLIGSWAGSGSNRSMDRVNAVLIRVLILAAVVFMYVFPELPQLEAKSLTWRTIVYPVMTLLLPAMYLLRGRNGPYPWHLDVNWAFVFTFDIVGNDLHWYGTWPHFDDFIHVVNSIPFVVSMALVFLALEQRTSVVAGFWVVMVFTFAVFFSLHSLWEMYEFAADEIAGTELLPGGMREATLNNLAGILGAVLAVLLLRHWRRNGGLPRIVQPVGGYLDRTVRGRPAPG